MESGESNLSAAKAWLNRFLSFCRSALDQLDLEKYWDINECRACRENAVKGEFNESMSDDVVSQFASIRSCFCSHHCYLKFLRRKRNESCYNTCLFPDCNKTRFWDEESYELKDYCGKRHAIQHKQIFEAIWVPNSVHSLSYSRRSGHQAILFYDSRDPYYEFTNFSYYPVVIDGVLYPTTEHYFQSQKLIGTPYCFQVASLSSPREAFEYPRQQGVRDWVRKDWASVKDDVMYRALFHKFTQHDNLRILLLMTDDRKLIEHSPYDSYWGDGPDGRGLNKLGELLMDLRYFLRAEIKCFKTDTVSEHTSENDVGSNTHNSPSSDEDRMDTQDNSGQLNDSAMLSITIQPESSDAAASDDNGSSSLNRLNENKTEDQTSCLIIDNEFIDETQV
ncbi:PREDICTED: uncharacterized protein LOC109582755 [Amphimedon queenslandica]|uniref:NADAR domain-containing protein n=1 Tax=Amphimedon queenslandica TaxID=400682 RepID=A0A1X7UNL1_AMPQE|nr:PREDICTED: uncharacterized protein LOC109582755 [Amphimedon queenslandica]|eukprot:XP_019853229.1 PREDICTED: uncharacterized protein LOC109582755 [Amphimedon queenslandica]